MTGPTLNNNPDQTQPTELRTIAAPVSFGIEELLHRIRVLRDADTRLTRRLEDLLKLGPTDLAALQHINTRNDENAPIRAADVSALLGITSAATTFLVSRLLKAGHLSREPDPTDKRAHTLHLSAETKAILDTATEPTRDELGAILGALSRRETIRANTLLTDITAAVNHGAPA
ncbi:DNA-binding MarR family transcriptional regulator [Frondihabitans sp. PhB188]|uniref:MarR family winged helix-turn-helix transcriptional regulator n=1 Tax=Frondihabitans sp. PhB188 TaxID=2485200 RepID=UPI000F482E6E|nr:MarR family winged helix-turn-helix transcriptional regulator [Frondihabitans sp. PhB188]ROQ30917.1 DNA-binding MarR family transcriptional regulator [Frondihabitans sp. PhB188]